MSNLVKVTENHNEIHKFKELFVSLKNGFRFSRLGKPFRTLNCNYFLDSGTGKVFMINENTYRVLECLWNTDEFECLFELVMSSEELLKSLKEIQEAVKNENILQMPPVEKMYSFDGEVFYDKDSPNVQTEHITLEMTERCNLRCKYCIYHEGEAGFRSFGYRDIDLDTCKKAVDILSESTKEEVYITFYGGEPLLRFDIMRETIEYSKKKLHNKKVFYNMTTNATLITEEIAKYWASLEHHSTLVSLDGPEWIHDKNRVYSTGTGSFISVMRGIKRLVEAEGVKSAANISYNIVLSDARVETLDEIQHFFRNSGYIPAGARISASYINTPPKKLSYLGVGTEEDRRLCESIMEGFDPLTNWSRGKLNSGESDNNSLISKDSYDKALARIHNRMLLGEPTQAFAMNGCCIPGGRRLYITVDGDLAICEKIGPSPFIGTVNEGIDYEKINKHYIIDFMNEATKYCNDCWAVNMCSLCYIQCYDRDGIDMSFRHELCVINRVHTEQALVLYHEMLEKNPESLAHLNEITYE
ncbi:radical SAM protein [Paenibacillus lentus]|uniref:Radical SAM protein n=1 Tax=Paenibacillus lentus TaxID=1338368 RepID=A0A3Q8SE22_9BACL|nr:radical SAM protein [Paenibacillus lentus]AZK48424.1 radical SAM protein [Paenibacillus lentus]